MNKIKNKLEYAIYGYEPSEFMPIRRDNVLQNKSEFIIYKLDKVIHRFTSINE